MPNNLWEHGRISLCYLYVYFHAIVLVVIKNNVREKIPYLSMPVTNVQTYVITFPLYCLRYQSSVKEIVRLMEPMLRRIFK